MRGARFPAGWRFRGGAARGPVPASGSDAADYGRLKIGSFVEVRPYRGEPSKALAAWWLLCGRTAEALDDTHTKHSISNRILLDLNMVETGVRAGGEPRSEERRGGEECSGPG
ncbi:hypothetical protein, partial [Methylobacterium radiotolerans]|uniref:hypothetical protein n=1 Tax=Methylobacterium radiotolerans TaxID=31998 RepID=UPI001181018F